ncbi:MAG: hypothetical protein K2I69_07450 [Muribaculaceae bacterium]|nr:hypothetical protein [Muribaculaceae bacterium]
MTDKQTQSNFIDCYDPENRQIENVFAEVEFCDNTVPVVNLDSSIVSIESNDFYKYIRRHKDNIFNALFYDKEDYSEDILRERISEISDFFDLPFPILIDKPQNLASITFTEFSELGSEIRFNVEMLKQCGINNIDAFDAVMCHELTHQYLANKELNFCINKEWSVELGCDFFVGVRCASKLRASGKYKYAVSRMRASFSHPNGCLRVKAVVAGFDFVNWMISKGIKPDAESSLLGLNFFLCTNSKDINNACLSLEEPLHEEITKIEISSFQETNLIKQALKKYKSGK